MRAKKRVTEYAGTKTQLTEKDYVEVFRQNERANDVNNGALNIKSGEDYAPLPALGVAN